MAHNFENKNIATSIARRYLDVSGDIRLNHLQEKRLLQLGDADIHRPLLGQQHASLTLSMRAPLNDAEAERLLENLFEDHLVSELLKPYWVKLRITIRRAYLLDDSILATDHQVVRQFVQLLVQLSDQAQWLTQIQQQHIQKSVEYLIEHFDRDIIIFHEVVIRLTQILIQRHKQFKQNVDQIIAASEQEQAEQYARQRLFKQLAVLFENRSIPSIVLRLLQLGWFKLLLSAYLQQGELSTLSRRGLAIVRHLMMDYQGRLSADKKTPAFQQKILHAIHEGLISIKTDEEACMDLLASLARYLLNSNATDQTYLSWALVKSELFPVESRDPVEEVISECHYILPLGAWVSYDALIKSHGPLKLIWKSSDGERLIFADRFGVKVCDKKSTDFFLDIKHKAARILTEKNCSSIDPGLDEIIRAIYSPLGRSSLSSMIMTSFAMDDCLLRGQPIIATRKIDALWREQLKNKLPLAHIFPPLRYEILLGMYNQAGEEVSPLAFVQAAEQDNQIPQVDRWVISNTFNWLARRTELWHKNLEFSINLSGQSVNDTSLLEFIFAEFKRTAIPHHMIGFEVTETSAVSNMAHAEDFIQEMKRIGCRFSLDDFGSGLSSYGYLKSLPVDTLKIDGLFVKNMANNPADYAMVKSITEMGHALNKRVVAEFVDSADVLEKLLAIGVDYVQGYFVGMPCPLDDLFFDYIPFSNDL